jgi:hypothetical protein
MPDTSSAACGRHAEQPGGTARSLRERACERTSVTGRPGVVSGIEPVDGTWFETGDESPSDVPLIVLVPVPRRH